VNIGRPLNDEAAPYAFRYINLVPEDDVIGALERQRDESLALFSGISEERSLHRYAPDKWSIRVLLSHVSDTERAFAFRALWFSRGFDSPLASFEQEIAAAGAEADGVSWAAHVEEFDRVRLSTISLFRNMPAAGRNRRGVASGNAITVRALAYLIAGHVRHHIHILRERYL
jgi:hypothetical protein